MYSCALTPELTASTSLRRTIPVSGSMASLSENDALSLACHFAASCLEAVRSLLPSGYSVSLPECGYSPRSLNVFNKNRVWRLSGSEVILSMRNMARRVTSYKEGSRTKTGDRQEPECAPMLLFIVSQVNFDRELISH